MLQPSNFPRFAARALAALVAATILACSKPVALPDTLAEAAADAQETGELNGNVLVARGGRVLYEASFGTANSATNESNKPDSRFLIASVSKPFTAVLILQLVEQKKLATSQRLDSLFPALANTPAGAITIDQLLTHTSG